MHAINIEPNTWVIRPGCQAVLAGKPAKAIPEFIRSAQVLNALYDQLEFNLELARGRWQRSRVGQPPSVGVCGRDLEPLLSLLPRKNPSAKERARFVGKALAFVADHPYDLIHFSEAGDGSKILTALYQLVWGARVIDSDDKAARPSRVSANAKMPAWSGKLEALLAGNDAPLFK